MCIAATALVSIITPAYRAEDYITECVQSVRSQTISSWEHIVVDDASPDLTWAQLEALAKQDSRLHPIRLSTNSGPAVARNAAIRQATGEFVAFLDVDDLWLPQKLERQIQFMRDRSIDFSFSWYERVDASGNRSGRIVRAPDQVDHESLLKSNHIGCLTAMYRRQKLSGLLMPEIPVHQDWAFWLKITRRTGFAYCLPEVLALYRHAYTESVSSNKLKTLKHKWRIYRDIEGLNVFSSLYYLAHLAVRGIRKNRI